jgi:23S rRNA (adenine-C8)-methyltransferase
MGMGEPFLNPNLSHALNIITSKRYIGISERKLSISTVGIPKGIEIITSRYPQISLTYSLHNPFNDERSCIIPLNKKYPIEDVFCALERHIRITRRKTYIAYMVIPGQNDSEIYANRLVSLVSRKNLQSLFHINLIKYNMPCYDSALYGRPDFSRRVYFFKKILESKGLHVTVRQSLGKEIGAACGQLVADYPITDYEF